MGESFKLLPYELDSCHDFKSATFDSAEKELKI